MYSLRRGDYLISRHRSVATAQRAMRADQWRHVRDEHLGNRLDCACRPGWWIERNGKPIDLADDA